ncbi:unnamed protein product [Rotaria sordida]|uniref:HAT C-terminal dimerisation domain-containing protein n=1 Tax=Rotaria sordida TaxID=392033 RepID=A0A814QZA1_9BILA|nr:unnamed protein product [Rotaria sordida]CAF4158120.1 unnamed protein product [Rotaria sordida]
MSSAQKSLTLYFKRKAIVEESDNNLAKKNKLNDNLNNILNDNVTTTQTISNTEPSRDTQPNINENCPLSTTANTTANDNKKRRYQKWYSDNYKWLIHEPNQGGFCRICRDYWKPTIPFYSEMNARTKGAFATQPFVNWKTAPGPNGSLEKHQQSSYHKTAVQNLSYRQQEGSVIEQLLNVSELERQENRQRFGDLLDAAYFLFKHELPHTTLYSSLLELLAKTDHSKKLSSFFDKCQKNASYDSTTTVTELLQAISEIIDEQILRKIRESRVISIMADEGTDINRHQNLSICIRYCNQDTGEPTESFISLLKIKDKDAQTIFDTIVKELEAKHIDMTKIRFTGFDGASVFSGEFNGVSAKFRQIYSDSILFIHCRGHILQLCLLDACEHIPEVEECLSTLKSLISFINRSSIRLARFNDIQALLQCPQIKLIRPGDTRWLSYFRSISVILRCYEPLMITLEHISNERDEESPTAAGLLSILENQLTIFLLHSLEPIFEALSILSKSIQTKNADFSQLEQSMLGTLLRLEELKDINITEYQQIFEIVDKIKTSSNDDGRKRATRTTTRTNEVSLQQQFNDKIVKFIDKIISNLRARFESNVLQFLNCFRIFDVAEVTDEPEYGVQQINMIKNQYPNDFNDNLLSEWKVFRKYLFVQKQQQTSTSLSQRQQCINLVKNGMLKDMYPQLSLAAEIFLCAPISTATVERDFSTMNRILTDLRNRLTTEHLEQLMKISIEGPCDLDNNIKDLIINCWKSKKLRRISV